ncbi:MAG: MaoC family dehydratase N-terminal domain-containing protein, partial [Pseudomonadales bacterium]|nr:MaoC family dehydratase N-terminal domain-containing protein [Pseudomonadales bacterium]
MSRLLDLDALRAQFLNKEFDAKEFRFDAAQLADYAIACGERAPRYTDPGHPDFQAPPTFATSLRPDRRLPDGFPKLPGLGMDAGKAVAPLAPIRPDTTVTGRSHLQEIYAKT